jgi:hypothetical protein
MARLAKSEIREKITSILFFGKSMYGYEIAKLYNQIFSRVSTRVIYYHLHKGCQLEIYDVDKQTKKQGDFSWGETSTIILYKLSQKAIVNPDLKIKEKVLEFLNKKRRLKLV